MIGKAGNHKSDTDITALAEQMLKSVRVPASARSKEEAWDLLVQKIEQESKYISLPARNTFPSVWKIVAAAASLLLIISFSYLKYSTVNVASSRGQILSTNLPDGSEVVLNACSQINYRRYWIINSRQVLLSGEAFFKVKKGKVFTVVGPRKYRVEVVGTQFNVSARDSVFKVTCFEGRVRVISGSGKSVELSGGHATAILGDSIIFQKIPAQISTAPSWMAGEFYFESASLQAVIEELMRQYRVNILINGFNPAERYYTGYFTNKDLKQALDWVTLPMNLRYSFINDTTVNIYPLP